MAVLSFITLYSQQTGFLDFRYITQSSGLSSINIRKIRKDSYGFIWAGSQDGLYRFDGTRFWQYNKNQGPGQRITGPDIRDLLFSGDTLWSINSFGGIDAINTVTGRVIFSWDQQVDNSLKDVYLSSFIKKGNKLYISGSNGLYGLDISTGKVKRFELYNPLNFSLDQKINISRLDLDEDGNLWLFTTKGIIVLNTPDLRVTGYLYTGIISFCHVFSGKNHVIAGTETGIHEYIFTGSSVTTAATRLNNIPGAAEPVYAVGKDKTGSIWFSTQTRLVKVSSADYSYTVIGATKKPEGEDWMASVFEIYFTDNNELWLGCQEGIAYTALRPPEFISFRKSPVSEEAIAHAYYIYPLNDSVIYVCAKDGLYKTNINTGIITTIDKGRPYFYMFRDFNGRLVASCSEGAFLADKSAGIPLRNVYPELPDNKTLVLSSHISAGDSMYIFGTQNDRGILAWNYKTKKTWFLNDASPGIQLSDNNINGLYIAGNGIAWILTDKSVMLWDIAKNKIRNLPLKNSHTGKNYSIFFDFCETSRYYYIASYSNGIIVLDKELNFIREISTADGLSNNGVYKLLLFRDSLIYATSNNGLSVINTRLNRIKAYYSESGLHSNNFEEFSGNTFGNTVFAGGAGGFTVIRPLNFTENKIPPLVYFTGVEIKAGRTVIDSFNLSLKKITIPNNVSQVTVYFSGINFSNPKQTALFYKVKELHNEWIRSDQQHFVSLAGINPGTYHLQLQAFNEDGVPGEIKQLILVFLPKWYQTWWFKTLIGLLIFVLAWAFYYLRISQLKKEQRIRTKLASDLHDDLGSTMNSVKVYANLAMMEYPGGKYPPLIKHSTQEAITGIRDMIWILDDSKDSVEDLLARISNFASPLCEANQVRYQQQMSDTARACKLGQEERRNLYMMLKEIINNSIKYAEAQAVSVNVSLVKGKPCFEISDNGKGFDTSVASAGNGIKNLKRRAKEIKYRLQISSSPGRGTSVLAEKS